MSEIKEEEEELNHPVLHDIEAATTISALEKISKHNFKSNEFAKKKIFHIKIKITGKIDENLNEACFAHCFDVSSSVLIAFKSVTEAKIFWKTSTCEKFHLIRICELFNEISSDFCEQFLINEIVENKNGILLESKGRRNINLQDLGNDKGQNLLMLAAIDNRDDVVAELLKFDFDADNEDHDGHNAIEKAWMNCMNASNLEIKEKCFKIILSLLKNNSKYPRKIEIKSENKNFEFKYKNCSEPIKNFVDYSDKLHNLVNESNIEELKLEIEKEPKLCYFYDKNNKSLMAHAMESKKVQIWKLLISLKLSTGHHEIRTLGNFYKNYEISKRRLMRAEHQKWSKELPSSHIYFLLTCSKIGNNDRRCDERWNLVEEAYRIMDTDESCSKVLKIASKWKNITIYFDFKHDTAYYLDPMAQYGTSGIIYESGTIYIGAKNLADEILKYEVIGVIIHELCHLAVNITYINNFDPYPKGESEEKTRFEDEVVPECEENGDVEEIVGGVAWYYPAEYHHSEYIVRIVQMLMHYYVQDPSIECENSKILKDRREKFRKLFEYFKDVVQKDFDDFLKIIDTLLDEYEEIKYEQLTGPMKAGILHSVVNFQGQETTLREIIGNNEEILNKLTTIQIRDLLVNNKCIDIGSKHTTFTKMSAIARTFAILDVYTWKLKTMSEIQSEVEYSKIFILSDSAGAGKTTTFEQLTEKLKENNKNFWVCFIKLRAHRSLFDSCNRSQELNLEDVLKLLIEIQNIKEGLEAEIFKFLFKNDKVILLLDGVDEISPDYNDFMVKVLKILREKTQNQLWISSRPQCARKIEMNLNIQTHMLKFYTIEERQVFINEIYDNFSNNLKNAQTNDQKVLDLNILNLFFETLDKDRYNYNANEVNNPLMIKMITELYIQKEINLNPESANLFYIFDKVTAKLRMEVGQKVESEDKDPFRTFNLGHVHQVLVLRKLFKYKDIKNLSIIKRWKKERTNWSVDRIQRFGFVTLDARFEKDPRGNHIDFIHRTYADFFAAQFIISVVFDSNCDDLKNNKDFKILIGLINRINIGGDSSFTKFLSSFFKNNKNKKIQGDQNIEWFCELFSSCIKQQDNMIKGKRYDDFDIGLMEFLLVLLSNNQNTVESIWKLKEQQNLLEHSLLTARLDIVDIFEILQISFGPNWYEKFNKNDGKIGFEISNIKSKINLFKYIENNFNILERSTIYFFREVYSFLSNMSESVRNNILLKIFMRFVEISSDEEEEAFLAMMDNFLWDFDNVCNLFFWKDQCDHLLQNCSKKDKNFLEKFKTGLIKRIFWGPSKEILKRIKITENIWMNDEKYKKEMMEILVKGKISLTFLFDNPDEEIKNEIIEIFKSNKLDLLNIFEYRDGKDLILHEDKFNSMKSFLSKLENPEVKIQFIRKILCFDVEGEVFTKPIENGKKCFIRLVDLLLFDVENYKNLQEYLFSRELFLGPIISKIMSIMTEEIYPEFIKFISKIFENKKDFLKQMILTASFSKSINSKEKYAILVNFLHDVFDQNDSMIAKCIRRIIIYYFSPLNFPSSMDVYKGARNFEILTIYGQCSDDAYPELYRLLKKKSIFLEIISEISEESCENFIIIFNKIFSRFEPLPIKCLICYGHSAVLFLKHKEKMKNLERFLNGINVDNEAKKNIKENIIYVNFSYILNNAVKDVEMFQTLIEFIDENNCEIEELKKILISKKNLHQIFMSTPKENFSMVTKYLARIYASNAEQIFEFIDFNFPANYRISDLRKNENFQFLDQFLFNIFGIDNKMIVDKCMINIYRFIYDKLRMIPGNDNENCTCIKLLELGQNEVINEVFENFFCEKDELILWIFYYENLEEIKILKDLTKNNKNHWEWAQDLFLDKFPFESIQRMSIETYDALENFLKLVFKSNIKKLSEKIQNKYLNDEILNNDNENCKKFVEAFINFEENN